MIRELDVVVLTTNLPDEGLVVGDFGAVVMVYNGGTAFEVEFVALNGDTISLVTLPANAIRRPRKTDVSHGRHRRAVA